MSAPENNWILCGPTGVTGQQVLAAAVARGHRPILAGRDPARLAALAARFGLATCVVDLADAGGLRALCRGAGLILNAAGPFSITGRPILDAAIAARCNYLDLNGELGFLLEAFGEHDRARAAGVAAVAGVGFGVAAGDCAAVHVAGRIEAPTWLRLGIAPASGFASPAVAASTIAVLRLGGRRVAGGALVACPLADRRWSEPDAAAPGFAAVPLAELAAAQRSTGIAEIVAGTPMPAAVGAAIRVLSPVLRQALRVPAIQRAAVGASGHSGGAGPAENVSRVWATAGNARGETVRIRLETGEAYGFAARAAIAAVEAMRRQPPRPGVMTPAQAFGEAFLTAVGDTVLRDIPGQPEGVRDGRVWQRLQPAARTA